MRLLVPLSAYIVQFSQPHHVSLPQSWKALGSLVPLSSAGTSRWSFETEETRSGFSPQNVWWDTDPLSKGSQMNASKWHHPSSPWRMCPDPQLFLLETKWCWHSSLSRIHSLSTPSHPTASRIKWTTHEEIMGWVPKTRKLGREESCREWYLMTCSVVYGFPVNTVASQIVPLYPCIQQPSKAVPVKSYTSSVCVWKELSSSSETKKKSSPGLPITVIKWKHSKQKCHTTQHSPWPAGRQRSDPHCDRVQNNDVVYCVLKPPS